MELSTLHYGTHEWTDVFFSSFARMHIFIVLFIIGLFISKKLTKKDFIVTNTVYLSLFVFYIIISIIKANALSSLPSHDLLKDLCGLNYELIQIALQIPIPAFYTIALCIKRIIKQLKEK